MISRPAEGERRSVAVDGRPAAILATRLPRLGSLENPGVVTSLPTRWMTGYDP